MDMWADDFPKTINVNGYKYTFRLMDDKDRNKILTFANSLPDADLAFMRRDITQPEAVDSWIQDIQSQQAVTILVEDGDNLVGYGSLYHNRVYWNRHVAEVRILVSSPYRNHGIGKKLARELTQLAKERRLAKVIAYMTVDNLSARHVMEDMGFRPEAILADWVKTRDERTHDLLIMSTSLNELLS
ncbi:MAG: N-acetyltransferase family protein [Phototrophicaceae bacterium]